MADSEEQQVSSTTPMLNEEVHHYQADPDPGPDPGPVPDPAPGPGPGQDLFSLDDIVDLVGGAQDALERHMAEDSGPPAATPASEAPLEDPVPVPVPEEPVQVPETVLVPEEPVHVPEPVQVPEEPVQVLEEPVPVPEPVKVLEEPVQVPEEPVKVPEPVKVQVPVPEPVKVPEEQVQVPVPVPESPVPDSTTPAPVPEEPKPVAPKAAPEVPEPPPGPPAPAPRNDAPPPAETPLTPAATREPAAPAKYSPSKAPPHPLMQFPTALGQKGDSPAPISPLSPLHSPDSLEELSLTESPNQPPPPGSFPPGAPSKDMPWEGEDGKAKEDLLDSLGGPYLSLGRDPGPRSACEDSGVSFSPEEKPVSSDRSPLNPQRKDPESHPQTKDPESHPQTKDPESNPQTKVPESNPQTKVPESHPASSNPTELWDSPLLSSQDNSKLPMDSFPKETSSLSSPRYDADLRGSQSEEEEDDLMREVKKNNNPFDGFSPLADSGYSHFGEPQPDSRASKMSDSPTPDLVQYGESQESFPTSLDLGKPFETGKMAADSLVQSMAQFTAGLKGEEDEEEEDALPPSLPDILKSSPLNPDKMDSGSSEGSPEEQSPIFERKMMESPNPPINLSANNPFAFDAKVSLLKEMTELMEGRKGDDDQTFGAFDLLKEAEETSKGEKETSPAKGKGEEPIQIGQKDWFSCQDPPKKPEPLDLKTEGSAPAAEDSDSESPTADSLSPVLEAMAKNPSIFQVETEKKDLEKDLEVEVEPEEVSEHEVSSEEFEFIERPPRGVIDEFLEALDTSKFASSKPPEIPLDEEPPRAGEEAPGQSSYRLLAQGPPHKGQPEDLLAQGPPLKGQPEDLLAQGPPHKGQPEDLQVKQPPAQPGPPPRLRRPS
ncbi:uncharacterized protein ACNS7B_017421 isoform 3-T3 [Menidia menidia]